MDGVSNARAIWNFLSARQSELQSVFYEAISVPVTAVQTDQAIVGHHQ